MAKFLYLYTGGQMAETPEAQAEQMQQWTAWFGTLGDSVVDIGNPFGAGTTVGNGGSSDGGASKLGGYSIINASGGSRIERQGMSCPGIRWHRSRCTKPSHVRARVANLTLHQLLGRGITRSWMPRPSK